MLNLATWKEVRNVYKILKAMFPGEGVKNKIIFSSHQNRKKKYIKLCGSIKRSQCLICVFVDWLPFPLPPQTHTNIWGNNNFAECFLKQFAQQHFPCIISIHMNLFLYEGHLEVQLPLQLTFKKQDSFTCSSTTSPTPQEFLTTLDRFWTKMRFLLIQLTWESALKKWAWKFCGNAQAAKVF